MLSANCGVICSIGCLFFRLDMDTFVYKTTSISACMLFISSHLSSTSSLGSLLSFVVVIPLTPIGLRRHIYFCTISRSGGTDVTGCSVCERLPLRSARHCRKGTMRPDLITESFVDLFAVRRKWLFKQITCCPFDLRIVVASRYIYTNWFRLRDLHGCICDMSDN